MTEPCVRCNRDYPEGHCKPINGVAFILKEPGQLTGEHKEDIVYDEKLDITGRYCKKCIKELIKIVNASLDVRET
jgi:hypothetical protein